MPWVNEMRREILACFAGLVWLTSAELSLAASSDQVDREQAEKTSKSGETLTPELAARFPNPPLDVPNDNGVNVLVDLAHQCAFATMWGLPDAMRSLGYRSMVSHASLDTVLTPGELSRMRIMLGRAEDGKRLRPFGWTPNPRFNLLITYQSNPLAQAYLPKERDAVMQFVVAGGGLVVIDNGIGFTDKQRLEKWAGQSLATTFGVDFKTFLAGQGDRLIDSNWERSRSIP